LRPSSVDPADVYPPARPAHRDLFTETEALGLIADEHPTENELVQWWLHLMVNSNVPCREVIAVSWHDHFATSIGSDGSTRSPTECSPAQLTIGWQNDGVRQPSRPTSERRGIIATLAEEPATWWVLHDLTSLACAALGSRRDLAPFTGHEHPVGECRSPMCHAVAGEWLPGHRWQGVGHGHVGP